MTCAISLSSIPPRFDRLGPVLRSLLAQRPDEAVTGAGFGVRRLGRRSHRASDAPERTDIAQGFSGVPVDPAWLACLGELTRRYGLWPPDPRRRGAQGRGGTGASPSTARAARSG